MLRKFGFELETNFAPGREEAASIIAAVTGGTAHGTECDTDHGTWKCVYDGSIRGTECEVVSPPLTRENLPTAIAIIRALRAAGAKGGHSNNCGLHIHVDSTGIIEDAQAVKRLAKMWCIWEETFIKFAKTNSQRLEDWCKPFVGTDKAYALCNLSKDASWNDAERAYYISGSSDTSYHYNNNRYHTLNLHNFWYRSGSARTIEFRLFETCLDSPRLLEAYVNVLIAFVDKVVAMKRVPRRENRETVEYAFYSMLYDGLKGPEFAYTRKVISERLRVAGTNLSTRGRSTYTEGIQ